MKDSLLHARVVFKTSNLYDFHVPVEQSTANMSVKMCATRAVRLFSLFYPMISLFCGVVVARRRRFLSSNRELKHARFFRRGRQPEVSCVPFNLSSHNRIYIAKYLFSIRND